MKPTDEAKRQAMSAVANVQAVVAQVGMAKLTGGVSLYAARIRQMDTQRQRPPRQRHIRRDILVREV